MAATDPRERRAPPRAGLRPFGIGETKPHHFLEIFRTAWENKRHPVFAWRVLRDGVCDGCALGTTGMRDFTMKGVHLCTVRLNLLKLNTANALDIRVLEDVARLRGMRSRELRDLGRLPYPMVRRRGDPGFHRVPWDEAMDLVAGGIRRGAPGRVFFFITSRRGANEKYYFAQKAGPFLRAKPAGKPPPACHAPRATS